MKYLKVADVVLFVFIVTSFFWYVPIKQFNIFKGVIGGMNFVPPNIPFSKFKEIKDTSKYLDELGVLCKGYPADSIGLLWEDYSKVIGYMMNREDLRYAFMMFEGFYESNRNPARHHKDELDQMDRYLVILSTGANYDTDMFVKKIEHFGLVERGDKK